MGIPEGSSFDGKVCDYCGLRNASDADLCRGCGSVLDVSTLLEVSEIPQRSPPVSRERLPVSTLDGGVVTLRCRTPEEAFLVRDELGEADILAILPDEVEEQYAETGVVEVRVSAKSLQAMPELQAAVESRYQKVRTRQTLPSGMKALAMGCGAFFLPGLLAYPFFVLGYQKHGYLRMAREFQKWFFLGLASWVLLILGLFLFTARSTSRPAPPPAPAKAASPVWQPLSRP